MVLNLKSINYDITFIYKENKDDKTIKTYNGIVKNIL